MFVSIISNPFKQMKKVVFLLMLTLVCLFCSNLESLAKVPSPSNPQVGVATGIIEFRETITRGAYTTEWYIRCDEINQQFLGGTVTIIASPNPAEVGNVVQVTLPQFIIRIIGCLGAGAGRSDCIKTLFADTVDDCVRLFNCDHCWWLPGCR